MNSQQKQQLVIVGNGMAAGRLVDELLDHPGLPYDITVIGDEPEGSYNRIMLSAVLAMEMEPKAIIQKDSAFYAANGITFLAGQRVAEVSPNTSTLKLRDGASLPYHQLVITTGASPAKIPALNQNLSGISSFRTLQDVAQLANATNKGTHALVVGGGLLGLEAAYGLALRGACVTLVHRSKHLLSRQLDAHAGRYLRAVMEAKNIHFELGTEVQQFNGRSVVESATLTNGKTIPCSLAVIATGITPNAGLAKGAGLAVNRGIQVNEYMQCSSANISALGECCEFNGTTFGLVEPIWQQCEVLARRLAGSIPAPFSLKPVATKLKVSGVNVFSAGEFETQEDHHELLVDDPGSYVYRKLLLRDNRIVGIVLFGDTRDGNFYFDLMQEARDVSALLPNLIFGKAYCDDDTIPVQEVA